MRRGDFQTSKVTFWSKQAHRSCEKNSFYWCKNHSDNFLCFHQILVQRLQKWAQRWGPSLFNQRKSKYLQQFWFTGFTWGLSSQLWIFNKTSKSRYLCSIGQKQRKTSQTSGFQTANQRRDFLNCVAFWHKKGISQWSKVSPKTALQGLSPDGLHGREL